MQNSFSRTRRWQLLCAALITGLLPVLAPAQESSDWFSWRGPLQNGSSLEHYEGYSFNEEPVWTYEVTGKGTPVVVGGRVFDFSYRGETDDLVELLTAFDAKTGDVVWQHEIRDFISDTVYNRYSVGSPTVDPETRNVYLMTTHGLFQCRSFDGELLWQISMMEKFGRLTFPNGRAGAPVIEGDLVIVRGITTNWGGEGPARDRFYAYNKLSGQLVWSSTPGVGPKDSSFSTPVFETRDGKRVFYAGTGCGNLVCVNARNGKPLWRFQMSWGGVNPSPVIHGDKVICIHGKENIDTSEEGRMVSIQIPDDLDVAEQAVLGAESEVWRNPLVMFSSSPVLAGGRVYQLTKTGNLACVHADSGEILWQLKLGADNIHSSPLYADGLLYAPLNDGKLHIVKPSDEKGEIIASIELEGNCLGAPVIADGHLYLHTTKKLYCFAIGNTGITRDPAPEVAEVTPGDPVALRAIPAEVLLTPGKQQAFKLQSLDANGYVVGEVESASWEKFIPPTAKVKAEMDAAFDEHGKLVAAPDAKASAGAFKATTADGLSGTIRGRVLPSLPYVEDFEGFELAATSTVHGGQFAYPPLPWIGARFKFEVRELEGNKVFAKTLDRLLFQRATAFIADPDLSNYTLAADVMTDGNRRVKSVVGLVNQRYSIYLVGNSNVLEVTSNHERFKHNVPFPVAANQWYRLKTTVAKSEGTTTIKAKAWPKGEDEPDAWTIELEHVDGHDKGAPGIFGFSPQAQKPVYLDNITITANE